MNSNTVMNSFVSTVQTNVFTQALYFQTILNFFFITVLEPIWILLILISFSSPRKKSRFSFQSSIDEALTFAQKYIIPSCKLKW